VSVASEDGRRSTRIEARAVYADRLAARRAAWTRLSFYERVVTEARLVVFLAGLIVAYLALRDGRIAPGWIAAPIAAFIGLVVIHDRLGRATHRAQRALDYYDNGIARIDDKWAGRGVPGTQFLSAEHPYAADLDLFGTGSVFERLCTARTRSGEQTLANWLLSPAPVSVIEERHKAIVELRPRLDLREDLGLLGGDVRAGLDPDALTAWGIAPRVFGGMLLRVVAVVLSGFAVVSLVGWEAFELGPRPFALAVALEVVLSLAIGKWVRQVVDPFDDRAKELILLSRLLARLEREPFDNLQLRRLQALINGQEGSASKHIAALAFRFQLIESRRNPFFAPIAALLFWTFHLACSIEDWRARWGSAVVRWIEAVGEFEALCALAGYAWENPADPFAEIEPNQTCFEAEALGHPLLPEAACVPNDVSLGAAVSALVVSGSNMSGKSTLLRAVGVNTVLALAGAPVRAKRLRVSPLAVGATLRIQDSLQAGRSRFFAEILRLKQVVDLSHGATPLLFLLDEILHGTNSHDRRIGAEAIIRGLIDAGAIGLVTTHDLALTEIVERFGSAAANVHFEDQFENGTLHFDYRMRPGVVAKSNAIELMRSVGLDI
jgi:hypothetical protein